MIVFVLLILTQISLFGEDLACQKALQMLKEGNNRFVSEKSIHPNRVEERRLEIASKQEPFAVILGCSDSRVAPEIIFDQGLGDLFIVRVAGNVAGPIELDSIEYSALYLHSCLVVVLGHENCGAISAVMQGKTKDIETVANLIKPAVDKAKNLQQGIQANVQQVVHYLNQSPVLRSLVEQKKLMIVGGYYNFHTGQVEFL